MDQRKQGHHQIDAAFMPLFRLLEGGASLLVVPCATEEASG
jgi:hypothetical protein